MFKRIDGGIVNETLEGFSYGNKDGDMEFVELDIYYVNLMDDTGAALSSVYYSDIPLMIKALQAAYEHNLKEKQND